MTIRWRAALLGLTCALTLGAHAVRAGTVLVSLKSTAGAGTEDAVIVFDPLDAAPPNTPGTAIIDQINKRFVPRVSVIRTGTAVAFPNSDSIRHQVYSFSAAHPFNLKLYASSHHEAVTFDKPGLIVLGCNIHDTMVAFIAVVDSPYFAKIPLQGEAAVDLPPGRYRLRLWHPKLATPFQSKEITVGSAPIALPLMVDVDPLREAAAPWPP